MNTMSMRKGNRRVRKSIAIIGEGLTEYRYVDDLDATHNISDARLCWLL